MRWNNCQYLEKEVATVSIQNLNASATIVDGQVVFAISQDTLTTYQGNTSGQVGPPSPYGLGVCAQTAADIVTNTTNPNALVIGIAKVNPTTSNINTTGVASIPLLGVGEAVCYGFTDAIVQRRTRTGTSASWASAPAIAAGDQLVPESINGYLSWSQTVALGNYNIMFVAAQSAASESTLTTGTLNTNNNTPTNGTVETQRMKVKVLVL